MKRTQFKAPGGSVEVQSEAADGLLRAVVDGVELAGPLQLTAPGEALWRVGDRLLHVAAAEEGNSVWVAVEGRVFRFERPAEDEYGGGEGEGGKSVAAPMPGKVIKLLVQPGEAVEEGQPVLIVEAMKMEHTLRAPRAGTVTALHCEEGQQVNAGVPLLVIEQE